MKYQSEENKNQIIMAAQASVSLNLEFSINTNYNVQLGEHKYMGQSGT